MLFFPFEDVKSGRLKQLGIMGWGCLPAAKALLQPLTQTVKATAWGAKAGHQA